MAFLIGYEDVDEKLQRKNFKEAKEKITGNKGKLVLLINEKTIRPGSINARDPDDTLLITHNYSLGILKQNTCPSYFSHNRLIIPIERNYVQKDGPEDWELIEGNIVLDNTEYLDYISKCANDFCYSIKNPDENPNRDYQDLINKWKKTDISGVRSVHDEKCGGIDILVGDEIKEYFGSRKVFPGNVYAEGLKKLGLHIGKYSKK